MYIVSVKMAFRPLTDNTAVRPQSTIKLSLDQSNCKCTICQHSGRNNQGSEL